MDKLAYKIEMTNGRTFEVNEEDFKIIQKFLRKKTKGFIGSKEGNGSMINISHISSISEINLKQNYAH